LVVFLADASGFYFPVEIARTHGEKPGENRCLVVFLADASGFYFPVSPAESPHQNARGSPLLNRIQVGQSPWLKLRFWRKLAALRVLDIGLCS